MANKGLNKVRFRAGDVPNVDNIDGSNSYQFVIRGEVAVVDIVINHMEFCHSHSRIGVLNCNNALIGWDKLSAI